MWKSLFNWLVLAGVLATSVGLNAHGPGAAFLSLFLFVYVTLGGLILSLLITRVLDKPGLSPASFQVMGSSFGILTLGFFALLFSGLFNFF